MRRLRELRDGRRATELAREAIARDRQPRAELLDVARDADHPATVTEVALDLTCDGRHGERGEAHLAVEVEPLDRLHQAERSDLLEVVQGLALVGVATGQRSGERQRPLDQLQPCTLILVVSAYLGSLMVFDQGVGIARMSKRKWRKLAIAGRSNIPPES